MFVGDLQCPEKCHPNAQCIELVVGGRKCVCNPGFEGNGIECAGKVSFLYIKVYFLSWSNEGFVNEEGLQGQTIKLLVMEGTPFCKNMPVQL